ncbi:MAG: hypothetical protein DRN25_02865 [Thermoplasmata archaeon]|nr:MAG: hypothetical protein DRN25_02865 [Thermoplasmata archaeon]
MQLYCIFCGSKLVKDGEEIKCYSCNTKFSSLIVSESADKGRIERSICIDCVTLPKREELKFGAQVEASQLVALA